MNWQDALTRIGDALDLHLFDIKGQSVTVGTMVVVLGWALAVLTIGTNLSALLAADVSFAVAIGFATQNIRQFVQVHNLHLRIVMARTESVQ